MQDKQTGDFHEAERICLGDSNVAGASEVVCTTIPKERQGFTKIFTRR